MLHRAASLTRHSLCATRCRWRHNERSIISQRMESAARDGDMEAVRALLKEYDMATSTSFRGSSIGSATSSRSVALPLLLTVSDFQPVI